MADFEPELGQEMSSNTPWGGLEAEDHVIAGIEAICLLAAGPDTEKRAVLNMGPAGNIENGTFELRAYCWCDGTEPGHEDGCPPNFRYGDFEVCWYKHSGRSASQNRKMPYEEWRRILIVCLESLESPRREAA